MCVGGREAGGNRGFVEVKRVVAGFRSRVMTRVFPLSGGLESHHSDRVTRVMRSHSRYAREWTKGKAKRSA